MQDWGDGYVVDSEYVNEYYEELAPAHLDLAALQRGIAPPAPANGRFRYCDLGCGNGLSATVIAAANPEAEIHGIDFMPGHIVNARELATESGLANAHFHEMSFAEAIEADLPQFDYVVMHGVYTWVMPEARREIVAFLRKYLAPGGLVYVSYNAYPGRMMIAPLWRLLFEAARIVPGPSDDKARAALGFAEELREVDPAVFRSNQAIAKNFDQLKRQPGVFISHEYLNAAWHPFYVTEVMEEMSGAKLGFAASADLLMNSASRLLTEAQRELVAQMPTQGLHELVVDYCLNTAFRRDVYSRGGRVLDQRERIERLASLPVGLTVAPERVRFEARDPGREVSFDVDHVRRAVAVLADGPCRLGDIAAALGDLPAAHDAAEWLIVSTQAMPLRRLGAGAEAHRVADRFTASSGQRAVAGRALKVLASPLGGGVAIGAMDAQILHHAREGREPGDLGRRVLAGLKRAGLQPSQGGRALEDAEALARLAPQIERFWGEVEPALGRLGIGAAAAPPALGNGTDASA